MNGAVVLETARLELGAWGPGDDEAFAEHLNTPAVMRWLGGVLSPEAVAAASGRYRRWQADRGYTFWVVRRRDNGAWLGFCGLKLADAIGSSVTGAVEIGWRFREDAWRQGYAGEAAEACLGHAFDTLDPERVVAVTVAGNQASWTLMERLGMRHRPDLDYPDPRYGPDLSPAVVYEIARETWAALTT